MFPDFSNSYFENLASLGRSASTIKRYRSDLNKFLVWLHDTKGANALTAIENLTINDFEKYLDYLETSRLSSASIKRLVTVLNNFLLFVRVNPPLVLKNAAKLRPLRPLTKLDFINDDEMGILLRAISTRGNSDETAARDFLIDRNNAIVYLMRFYGLTPSDIHKITMHDINFAQNTLVIHSKVNKRTLTIDEQHMMKILNYYNSIPKLFRPHYNSSHPLFVAFFNVTMTYYYDYVKQHPRRLSVRAIQEMLKDEVRRAGLRKLSAATLRNSAILEQLNKDCLAHEVIAYFGLSDVYSLRRYEKYLEYLKNSAD
jgi:site-specific recombinase XerD